MIAQPVQLSKKSKGIDHAESAALAFKVRSLAIDLFNEHDCLHESQQLSKELETLFAEVPVVLDKVSEDLRALDGIQVRRKQQITEAEEEKAEFAAAVTYETTFGLIFKDRFRISPDGVEWKSTITPLESITGIPVRFVIRRKRLNTWHEVSHSLS